MPLQPEFEDNVVVMNPDHPTATAGREAAESARAASAPVPKSRAEQMDMLFSTVKSMQMGIKDILENQHSLVRILENRVKMLNNKVDG